MNARVVHARMVGRAQMQWTAIVALALQASLELTVKQVSHVFSVLLKYYLRWMFILYFVVLLWMRKMTNLFWAIYFFATKNWCWFILDQFWVMLQHLIKFMMFIIEIIDRKLRKLHDDAQWVFTFQFRYWWVFEQSMPEWWNVHRWSEWL